MDNNNVIDLFTRKSFEEITKVDTKENDALTAKYGTYLGCIRKKDSDMIRSLISQIEFKNEQINQLTSEWEQLCLQHEELLIYCLTSLSKVNRRAKEISITDDKLMISEDGHIWVIDVPEKNK